jgi:hypothetical protein
MHLSTLTQIDMMTTLQKILNKRRSLCQWLRSQYLNKTYRITNMTSQLGLTMVSANSILSRQIKAILAAGKQNHPRRRQLLHRRLRSSTLKSHTLVLMIKGMLMSLTSAAMGTLNLSLNQSPLHR